MVIKVDAILNNNSDCIEVRSHNHYNKQRDLEYIASCSVVDTDAPGIEKS